VVGVPCWRWSPRSKRTVSQLLVQNGRNILHTLRLYTFLRLRGSRENWTPFALLTSVELRPSATCQPQSLCQTPVPILHSLVTSQARSCEIVVAILSVWNVDTDVVEGLSLEVYANIEWISRLRDRMRLVRVSGMDQHWCRGRQWALLGTRGAAAMGRCSRDALSATSPLHGITVVRLSVSNASDVTSFASTNPRVIYHLLFPLSPLLIPRRSPRALLSTPEDLRLVAYIIDIRESRRIRCQHAVHALLSLVPCPRGWNRYVIHTTAP